MKWGEVQQKFPNEWVVVEVTKAHSQDDHRFIDELNMINRYDNSPEAMRRYYELHRQNPTKEYGFFHTSRPTLIAIEKYVGVRGPQ